MVPGLWPAGLEDAVETSARRRARVHVAREDRLAGIQPMTWVDLISGDSLARDP